MTAYVVAQIDITDPEKFKTYGAQVPATIEKHGGRYLARGGRMEVLEGEAPYPRTVVIEFPSFEEAKAWYDSADYAGPKALRLAASKGTVILIEGV